MHKEKDIERYDVSAISGKLSVRKGGKWKTITEKEELLKLAGPKSLEKIKSFQKK